MTEPTTPEGFDAYALLSKPTLDLTDAEVLAVVEDLRRRRAAYIKTGKPDKPKAERAKAAKMTVEDKARNTEALLATLKLKI